MIGTDEKIRKLHAASYKLTGNCSGVYYLFHEDELVYIGSSWNCFLRVAEHTRRNSPITFNSWYFEHIEAQEKYRARERELIQEYRPRYNNQYNDN